MSTETLAPQADQAAEQAQQAQVQHIEGQEQLFNDTAYDQEAIAQRSAAAEATLAEAVASSDIAESESERIRLNKPVSDEEAQAAKDALALLSAPDEELPDAVKVKRDYSDNLAEHKEKQEERKAAAAAVLESRVAAHAATAAVKEQNAADNQKISDKLSLDMSREAKTAAVKEGRAADAAKREELRQEYIDKQRLLRGEGQSKLFADEISREADKYVKSVMHPGSELRTDNVVDTRKLKDEKYGKTPANVVKNEETRNALTDFYKGFPDKEAAKDAAVQEAADLAEAQAANEKIIKTINPAESKEDAKEKPGMRILSYKPNAEGMSEMAVEFTEKGLKADLAELSGDDEKCLIFNTEETDDFPSLAFYVEEGEVYNLSVIAKTGKEEGGWSVSEMGDQTTVQVGESVMINGVAVSGPINKLMIEMPDMHVNELDEDWEALDEVSPFQLAGELVDKVQAAEKEAAGLSVKEEGRVLMQERPKQAMNWAAKQLRRLRKNAKLAIGVRAKNAMYNAKEYFSDEERGKRRRLIGFAAGAIALAGGVGAAYLELSGKGTGVSDQIANRPRGGSVDGSHINSMLDHDTASTISDHAPKGSHLGDSSVANNVDHVKTVTVKSGSGDTLWNEATQKLHRQGIVNPTNNQINIGTLRLEQLNHITPEQAHLLASEGDQVIKV